MIQVINSHYNDLKAITDTITIALGLHKLGVHLQKIHYLFSFEWLSLLNHLASPSHQLHHRYFCPCTCLHTYCTTEDVVLYDFEYHSLHSALKGFNGDIT